MGGLLETLKKLGPVKLAALGGVALVMVILFGVMAGGMSGASMQMLYSKLDTKDATRIVAELSKLNIPYQLTENGTTIMVPPANVGKARISMAELGLPQDGSVGYELFDNTNALGTSTFQQNISKMRALEGELARTISAIDAVRTARVHLVMPERELFSRDKQKARASVFVGLRGKGLSKTQIAAIQHLVAAAVPQLEVSNISIIDDKGNLIARGSGQEDDQAFIMMNNDEMRIAQENRLKADVEELIASVVGPGNVRAQISAEMDFNKVTRDSEVYDPESKVERSTQNVTESETANEKSQNVSVANNLPEAEANRQEGSANVRAQNRQEETINYEISRTVTKEVSQIGQIKRLSVALLVDGTYTTAEDGTKTYQPRDQAQLDKIEALVKNAIGFDANRGDSVEVLNMQFADTAPTDMPLNVWDTMSSEEYIKIAQTLIMMVMGLLVILLIVRPLTQRLVESAPSAAGAESAEQLLAAAGLMPALEAPDGSTLPVQRSAVEEMLDIDRVEGQLKASMVRRIGELIDKHPDEAIQVIRNWMQADT
ncbi:MAG: flagellar M-ring protein FliF [Alphaproteobacteria bacterium]|nr:flagellar M-ring protein FliF [Thalassospira sp.]MCE2964599.1 flagellar M-ring protein FliF [Alphaproteobacteria bacterium]